MAYYNEVFTLILLLKATNSIIYLITNYLVHKLKLKAITMGNFLRLLGACVDYALLLVLLFRYVWECGVLGFTDPLIGFAVFIFTCAVNWAMLIRRDNQVQPIFIIGMFSFVVLILLNWFSIFTAGLVYKEGSVPALLLLNTVYLLGWLVFEPIAKRIIRLAESIGENLAWVDPLMAGHTQHKDFALRNVCSFNLGLLHLAYIHISLGGAVNKIALILIGLGLLTNILIGLRLIKIAASVQLENSFMVHIIKYGYNNIHTIYNQLKNKQLPKATWYAWAITLTMGVTFISPCYAMSTGGEIVIDASLQGELPQEAKEGYASPVNEGASRSRAAQEALNFAEHNQQEFLRKVKSAPAGLYSGLLSGLGVAGTYAASQSGIFGETVAEQAETAELAQTIAGREAAVTAREAAIAGREAAIADREAAIATREEVVALREQRPSASWSGWFKSCWRGSSNE